jgi:chromosome segregation protein
LFLTKLELHGFKSFVDRTEVSFGNGITSIVGPNGCGKTNISDAIRWVMGEQSAKQLRGDAMDDVIFNGSARRKPVGMAEVTLTMKNDKGVLPTEYTEVEIGRRVYRSGQSDYLLNRQVVRLKDIRDLFFDTGMGSHAYSVIERQMVDNLLSDTTGHRRFLFEEASGISKYKQRKRECLNKLEATQTDLVRVTDLLVEIEKEIGSLARQVAKARRYDRLRGEIQDLDLRLSALRHGDLIAKEREMADEQQAEAVRREAAQTELDTREAALQTLKIEQIDEERMLAGAQQALAERENARSAAQHESVMLDERAAGLEQRIAQLDEELTRAAERLEELTRREIELKTALAEAGASEEGSRAALSGRENDLAAVEGELKETRSETQGEKQRALDLFQAESNERAECARARERLANLADRREAAEAALRGLAERLERVAQERAEADAAIEEATRALAGAEGVAAELTGRGTALEREAEERLEQETALRAEAAAVGSRLSTLEEMKQAFEGVDEAVKAFLAGAPKDQVAGLVADLLNVPAAWLDAVEAALGTTLSAVVLTTDAAVQSARDALVEEGAGRVALVALDRLETRARAWKSALGARYLGARSVPESVALADLVTGSEEAASLPAALLAGVFGVPSEREAAEAAQAFPEFTWVTAKGTVYARGLVVAGRAIDADRGLLRREHDLRALAAEKAALEKKVAEAADARAELLRGREAWQAEVRTHAETTARLRESAQTARGRAEGLVREHEQAEREREARLAETVAVAHDEAQVTEQLDALEASLAETANKSQSQSGQVATLEERVGALEARREALAQAAAEARAAWMHATQQMSTFRSDLAQCEATARELTESRAQRTADRAAAEERLAETRALRERAQSGLSELLAAEAAARTEAEQASARTLNKREIVRTEEDALRGLRHEANALAELVHTLEVNRLNARSELDRTLERLRVEYDVDLTSYVPAPWDEAERGGPFDPVQADLRLEEQRRKFRELGPVNLLALEEYTRKKERYDFLKTQVADLQSARDQLLEAIEKINSTASQLFLDTFSTVQQHFADTFATLFVGGTAEIRMIGDDPLECDIDIVARPRGKNLQSISLLSSGERALTAIALLFAIYLIKPSPFCLLDEVDAPLDEANVDRFVALLRRFSEKTQFIMITHNKKTMEAAASLYGVTMQEPGVSKLMSVRFETPETRETSSTELLESEEASAAAVARPADDLVPAGGGDST